MNYQNPLNSSNFKSNNFEMWVEDGIFHVVILTDYVTLDIAEECVKQRMRITQGKSYPMLSDSRKVVHFEKEARKFLALNENVANLNAGAILIENQLQKILGNFFLHVNKPGVPARMFTEKEKALSWLEHFKL